MKTLLIEKPTTEVAYIFKKLTDTIKTYNDLYPELMYITSGLELVKKEVGTEDSLALLIGLNTYMKHKLAEYHVIKIMLPKLQQDLDMVRAGLDVDREKELYLEFSYYKDFSPIK